MQEIWKPIEAVDGKYEVSNLGQVRSVARKKPLVFQHYPYMSNGRPFIVIQGCGMRKAMFVSRLVAEAFVENPLGFNYVNEKDGDIMNCRADNLEWTPTSKKVQLVSFKDSAIRCRCIELDRICDTMSEMAQVLGVSNTTVSNAIRFGRKIKKKYTVVALGKIGDEHHAD